MPLQQIKFELIDFLGCEFLFQCVVLRAFRGTQLLMLLGSAVVLLILLITPRSDWSKPHTLNDRAVLPGVNGVLARPESPAPDFPDVVSNGLRCAVRGES
jgi:hypothetical protein